MLKIKMYMNSKGYRFRPKATSVLLDCAMDEFDKEFKEKFSYVLHCAIEINNLSPAIKIYRLILEDAEFVIEVKEVNKIKLETVIKMILTKSGLIKEVNNG